jgi:WD40 repeat protein
VNVFIIYNFDKADVYCERLFCSLCHSGPVKSLSFSPRALSGSETIKLGSGSEDHTVRIFSIALL